MNISTQYWNIVLVIIAAMFTASILLTGGSYKINPVMGNNHTKTTNIAHRGARSLAPENTLIAARKAYEAGADMWETDVQFTRDRNLVLIHDDTLLRTTDVESVYPNKDSYTVSDFTLDEIKKLDAGSWFVDIDPFEQIEQGKLSPSEIDEIKEAKVPTLHEGLELTRQLDWKVNLEIKPVKNGAKLIVKRVVGLVEEMNMEDDVVISSFDHSLVKFAGELNPEIATALLVEEPSPNVVQTMRQNGAEALNLAGTALEEERVVLSLRKLKAAGDKYTVNVFTVNDQDVLKSLVRSPTVDGIFTDFPGRLTSILES